MSNDLKWMLGSDFHIPYQDDRYIALWFKVMKWFKPDVIDYLGDISDQDCYSRFDEGKPNEFLNAISQKDAQVNGVAPLAVEQEKDVRALYAKTRAMMPNAEMFSALGNHDIRVWNYFEKKMPTILDHVTVDDLWDFKNLGIDYIHYNELPKHRYGDIYVHHGIKLGQHAGESVRKDVEEYGVSIIRGHSHRMGSYYNTWELKNETWRGYEIGHMTDITSSGMSYASVHNWQPGFAIAHIESGCTATKDGWWPHVQLIHVSPDYTCVVDGKKFAA